MAESRFKGKRFRKRDLNCHRHSEFRRKPIGEHWATFRDLSVSEVASGCSHSVADPNMPLKPGTECRVERASLSAPRLMRLILKRNYLA
jgi:hypothetical protein